MWLWCGRTKIILPLLAACGCSSPQPVAPSGWFDNELAATSYGLMTTGNGVRSYVVVVSGTSNTPLDVKITSAVLHLTGPDGAIQFVNFSRPLGTNDVLAWQSFCFTLQFNQLDSATSAYVGTGVEIYYTNEFASSGSAVTASPIIPPSAGLTPPATCSG